jgi:nucleotide-binding universal stress UspA family protein
MLRSILLGLDGSQDGRSALELGIEWARRDKAMLVGIGIIDEPTIAAAAPTVLGGPPYADPIVYRERMADARRQVDQFLEEFSLRCAKAGVSSKVLEEVGLPSDEIVRQAQRYDLILIGRKTRFHFEIQEQRDTTLQQILRDSPRPVVVVPSERVASRSVVIAYDGSIQAARALHQFRCAGLGREGPVHVVSVHADHAEAARLAEPAMDYLHNHAIRAVAHAIVSPGSPAEVLLDQIRKLDARLLVMGACGQSRLRESLLGSVTRTLLKESPVPVFLDH